MWKDILRFYVFSRMNFTHQYFSIYALLLVSIMFSNNIKLEIRKAVYFSKVASYSMSNTENKN